MRPDADTARRCQRLFAVLALISGELTALSLLLVTLVVLWFETTVRDAWHSTHHPMTA